MAHLATRHGLDNKLDLGLPQVAAVQFRHSALVQHNTLKHRPSPGLGRGWHVRGRAPYPPHAFLLRHSTRKHRASHGLERGRHVTGHTTLSHRPSHALDGGALKHAMGGVYRLLHEYRNVGSVRHTTLKHRPNHALEGGRLVTGHVIGRALCCPRRVPEHHASAPHHNKPHAKSRSRRRAARNSALYPFGQDTGQVTL